MGTGTGDGGVRLTESFEDRYIQYIIQYVLYEYGSAFEGYVIMTSSGRQDVIMTSSPRKALGVTRTRKVEESGGLGVKNNPKGNAHDWPKSGTEDGGRRVLSRIDRRAIIAFNSK